MNLSDQVENPQVEQKHCIHQFSLKVIRTPQKSQLEKGQLIPINIPQNQLKEENPTRAEGNIGRDFNAAIQFIKDQSVSKQCGSLKLFKGDFYINSLGKLNDMQFSISQNQKFQININHLYRIDGLKSQIHIDKCFPNKSLSLLSNNIKNTGNKIIGSESLITPLLRNEQDRISLQEIIQKENLNESGQENNKAFIEISFLNDSGMNSIKIEADNNQKNQIFSLGSDKNNNIVIPDISPIVGHIIYDSGLQIWYISAKQNEEIFQHFSTLNEIKSNNQSDYYLVQQGMRITSGMFKTILEFQ